jgi:hypothetical protein
MTITVTSNTALTAGLGQTSSQVLFTTDAAAAITTTVTGNANDNKVTAASTTGFVQGDIITIANGGLAGANPWVNQILTIAGSLFNTAFPSTRAAVTSQLATRWERIETRFKAKTILLTDLTNGVPVERPEQQVQCHQDIRRCANDADR